MLIWAEFLPANELRIHVAGERQAEVEKTRVIEARSQDEPDNEPPHNPC